MLHNLYASSCGHESSKMACMDVIGSEHQNAGSAHERRNQHLAANHVAQS